MREHICVFRKACGRLCEYNLERSLGDESAARWKWQFKILKKKKKEKNMTHALAQSVSWHGINICTNNKARFALPALIWHSCRVLNWFFYHHKWLCWTEKEAPEMVDTYVYCFVSESHFTFKKEKKRKKKQLQRLWSVECGAFHASLRTACGPLQCHNWSVTTYWKFKIDQTKTEGAWIISILFSVK